jgi:hypothetical protein
VFSRRSLFSWFCRWVEGQIGRLWSRYTNQHLMKSWCGFLKGSIRGVAGKDAVFADLFMFYRSIWIALMTWGLSFWFASYYWFLLNYAVVFVGLTRLSILQTCWPVSSNVLSSARCSCWIRYDLSVIYELLFVPVFFMLYWLYVCYCILTSQPTDVQLPLSSKFFCMLKCEYIFVCFSVWLCATVRFVPSTSLGYPFLWQIVLWWSSPFFKF